MGVKKRFEDIPYTKTIKQINKPLYIIFNLLHRKFAEMTMQHIRIVDYITLPPLHKGSNSNRRRLVPIINVPIYSHETSDNHQEK